MGNMPLQFQIKKKNEKLKRRKTREQKKICEKQDIETKGKVYYGEHVSHCSYVFFAVLVSLLTFSIQLVVPFEP